MQNGEIKKTQGHFCIKCLKWLSASLTGLGLGLVHFSGLAVNSGDMASIFVMNKYWPHPCFSSVASMQNNPNFGPTCINRLYSNGGSGSVVCHRFIPALDPRDWSAWSLPDRTPSFEASEPESSCFPKTYIYVRVCRGVEQPLVHGQRDTNDTRWRTGKQ